MRYLLQSIDCVRAVAADLDGTLLPAHKHISPQMVEILQQLKDREILFFPVTGKALALTEHIFRSAAPDIPLACLDGAVIKVRGRTLWDEDCFIPRDLVQAFLDLFPTRTLFLLDEDLLYIQGALAPEVVKDWASVLGGSPEEADLEAVTHIVFPDSSMPRLKDLRAQIEHLLPDHISTHLPPEYYHDNYHLLIRSKRMTKYRGAVRLLDAFGLNMPELLFFGDWRNDIPLLKEAGLSVAMRNAVPEVADWARACTRFSNEELGVERCLAGFFELKGIDWP